MCHRVSDIPAQVPPLTPGTNKKMTEALEASFASWEKERVRLNITKGECRLFSFSSSFFSRYIPISRKTFLLSFFLSFFLSLFCSLLFMHVSWRTGFSTISNYPLIAATRRSLTVSSGKTYFLLYISIYRLLGSFMRE